MVKYGGNVCMLVGQKNYDICQFKEKKGQNVNKTIKKTYSNYMKSFFCYNYVENGLSGNFIVLLFYWLLAKLPFYTNGNANLEFLTKSKLSLIIARYGNRPLLNLLLAVLQRKSQNPLHISHC